MSQTTNAAVRRFPQSFLWLIGIIIAGFALLQLVRFVVPEFQLDNPPVTRQIAWNSPEAKQLWRQACADCHSNETYPLYN